MDTLYASYRKWRKACLIEGDGIVLGSDSIQEWLLPWWWDHYSRYNSLPVTFIDFGMNQDAWKRGKIQVEPVYNWSRTFPQNSEALIFHQVSETRSFRAGLFTSEFGRGSKPLPKHSPSFRAGFIITERYAKRSSPIK